MNVPTRITDFCGRNRVSPNTTTGTTTKFIPSAAAMNRPFRNARRILTNGISRKVTYNNTASTGLMSGLRTELALGRLRPTPIARRTATA